MAYFILRRAGQASFLVLFMSVLVFVSIYAIGNPIDVLIDEESCDAECYEAAVEAFGFDRPLYEQYFYFVSQALQGDLGDSFRYHRPAISLILSRLPATLELAFVSFFMAVVVGIPLGLYAGLRANRPESRAIMAGSIFGFSLPNFWVGLVLIMTFAVYLGWLPSTGRGATVELFGIKLAILTLDGWAHLILPAFTLALTFTSVLIRLTRAGVREVMPQDFVKFARAKGMPERRIVTDHVLRNIMIPIVTVSGVKFGSLIAFGVVTETVFAYPGMGKLLIDSINQLDRPVIVSWLMIIVLMFVVINFVVDILYSLLDPRVRVQDMG